MSKTLRKSLQVDADSMYQLTQSYRGREHEFKEFIENEGFTKRLFLDLKYGANFNEYKRLLVETMILELGLTLDKTIKRHHAK